MKLEHLNIYYCEYNGIPTLFKYDDTLPEGNVIFIYKDKLSNSSWAYWKQSKNLRLATPDECHWLNECIRESRYIAKEKALKTYKPDYQLSFDL